MSPTINTQKITRPLYDWEIIQARLVFGETLQYEKVRIHEYARWPDTIDDVGRKLKKVEPRNPDQHNAITLGYGCYFPTGLPINQPQPQDQEFTKTGWLIHELTHCWQYEKLGLRYLFLALSAQFSQGASVYEIGDADELVAKRQQGYKFLDFNPEQQGRLNETFYVAMNNLPGQQAMYEACLLFVMDERSLA